MIPRVVPTEPSGARLVRHVRVLGRLAWPVMLSRAGILAMSLVDVIMLGHYSTEALAQASVALGLFIPIMVSGVGLQMGVISIIARRHGAGNPGDSIDAWLRALPWSVVAGLIGTVLMGLGETWLTLIGHDAALVAGGGAFSRAVAPGVLFQVLYVASAFYLEGTGRPKPAMLAMVAANFANAGLNWLLIYGNLGAPELGAVGSALATTLVRVLLFTTVLVYILRLPEVRAHGILRRFTGVWGPGGWAAGAEMRRLGYAAGLSVFFETSAFGAMTQMAGILGPVAVASYSIAHNIEATIFMIALGLSVATGIRVGGGVGAGRMDEAAFAGWTGLGVCLAVMSGLGLLLATGAGTVTAFYTNDPAVTSATAGLIAIVALMVLPDGAQIVMGQCNRAMGDAYVASALYFLAFWGVMVPLAALLVFGMGIGVAGLLWASLAGASVSLLLQGGRFAHLTRVTGARAAPAASDEARQPERDHQY